MYFFLIQLFLFVSSSHSVSFSRYKNRVILLPAKNTWHQHRPVENFRPMSRSFHGNENLVESIDNNNCEYGICEISQNYPEDAMMAVLTKSQNIRSFFGKVIEPLPIISISNRDGDIAEQPVTFCNSTLVRKLPLEIVDVHGEKRYIANVGEEYKQTVTFEVCSGNGRGLCGEDVFPLDVTTRCEQKYNVIKLLSLSNDRSLLEYVRFRIPSTCVCVYD